MRRYLLDTSVLFALLNNRPGAVKLILPWIQAKEAPTSILVNGEVVEHISRRANYPELILELRTLLRGVYPFFLSYAIMERYADIRLQLRPRGQLIGDVDTLIAATALERDLTVVTIDPDYQRVPGLKVQLLSRAQLA
jgi:predicted nucleic acid-binding protein